MNNILEMLQSFDEENKVLALTLLEEQKIKEIENFLLFCYKFGTQKEHLWKTHAPNCLKTLKTLGGISPYFSFQQLFTLITKENFSIDELEIFFEAYSKFLTKDCKNPKIKKIEITIKLNENETK